MSSKLVAVNVRAIPFDLKNKFKAYCARQGVSMTRAVTILISMAITENINLSGNTDELIEDARR